MVLPIVTPAPVVVSHAEAFRDLFDHQCEFRYFQNYLTGLIAAFVICWTRRRTTVVPRRRRV